MSRADGLARLSSLCVANADAWLAALEYCASSGVGCFRILSQILSLKTHPQQGYYVDDLSDAAQIIERFRTCGEFVQIQDRLRFDAEWASQVVFRWLPPGI